MMMQISKTIGTFIKDTDKGNFKKIETHAKLYKSRSTNNKQAIEANKARMDYDKMIEDMARPIIRQIRIGKKQELVGVGSHKKISKCINGG